MNKGRGAYKEKKQLCEDYNVTYVRWFGNKIVHIVSTLSQAKTEPKATVSHFDKILQKK